MLTCPTWGGVPWELDDNGNPRYRCHVGPVFSPESLQTARADDLETAL